LGFERGSIEFFNKCELEAMARYIKQCFEVLRPGGKLIMAHHFVFLAGYEGDGPKPECDHLTGEQIAKLASPWFTLGSLEPWKHGTPISSQSRSVDKNIQMSAYPGESNQQIWPDTTLEPFQKWGYWLVLDRRDEESIGEHSTTTINSDLEEAK
jgi:hypothetical protein